MLKTSHTFNLLDARKAISVTERQRFILRVRDARQGRRAKRITRAARRSASRCSSAPAAERERMSKRDFLFEIGTEELPPKSLFTLAQALAEGVAKGLDGGCDQARRRRMVRNAAPAGGARARRWPIGNRIRRSNGRDPRSRMHSTRRAADQGGARIRRVVRRRRRAAAAGRWPEGTRCCMFVGTQEGRADRRRCCPAIVKAALDALPIAQAHALGCGRAGVRASRALGRDAVRHRQSSMRDSRRARRQAFARPSLPRAAASSRSRARRSTARRCCEKAHVVADVAERRERIRSGVTALAQSLGGHAVIDDALLDEVTALVEWPVPLAGRFDEQYLELPQEVPIATMQDHQRYFPVRDARRQADATRSSRSPISKAAIRTRCATATSASCVRGSPTRRSSGTAIAASGSTARRADAEERDVPGEARLAVRQERARRRHSLCASPSRIGGDAAAGAPRRAS